MTDGLPRPGKVVRLSGRLGDRAFGTITLWSGLDRTDRVCEVKTGTRAEVLLVRRAWEMTMVRVRLLDGDHAGLDGWVRTAFAEEEVGE